MLQNKETMIFGILLGISISVSGIAKTPPCPSGTHLNPKAEPLIMYTAEWCHYCKDASAFLQKKGIPFEAYDIELTARGVKDYKNLGKPGVPIFSMGNRRLESTVDWTLLEQFYYEGACLKNK